MYTIIALVIFTIYDIFTHFNDLMVKKEYKPSLVNVYLLVDLRKCQIKNMLDNLISFIYCQLPKYTG